MVALQILSDVHLEFRSKNYVPPIHRKANYLALLGDIGRPFESSYEAYLSRLSREYQRVFLVAGNHEYYGDSPRHTSEEIETQICTIVSRYENIEYLQNRSIYVDGVRLIGSTLWTHIPPESVDIVQKSIHDYRLCFTSATTALTPGDTNRWHQRAVAFIRAELERDSKTPTILLTHHAPTFDRTSNPKYMQDALKWSYATDLTALFRSPIRSWCFGHTHWPTDYRHGPSGIRIVSNPKGYKNDDENFRGIRNPVVYVSSGISSSRAARSILSLPGCTLLE